MGDFLNTTNVIIGIIAGLFTIFGPIVGVFKRRQTALKNIENQPPEVQIEIRERWSVLGLIWRAWMGILVGLFFAAIFTAVLGAGLFAGITYGLPYVLHITVGTSDVISIAFAIAAIVGVSVGITEALAIVAPKRFAQSTGFARSTGQTSRSMLDPNNPIGWTHPNSPNNPNRASHRRY